MILKSGSSKETKKIAIDFAKKFKDGGGIIGLSGDLGAGKTTFAQGFAEGLGVKEKVTSPTFVLIREHQIPDSIKRLIHIDLYRVDGQEELGELGLNEILESGDVVLIEWAEKIKEKLNDAIWVNISKESGDERLIAFENID